LEVVKFLEMNMNQR